MKSLVKTLATGCLILLLSAPALALTPEQAAEFDRILNMGMDDLSASAAALLEKKYPDEDWEKYDFPSFVFTSAAVETGYRIAVKVPELLGAANVSGKDTVIPCYCFCDAMGHKNLLYCFFKDGRPGGRYDDHAAGCNICYGQAMLAFLWNEAGASHAEIIKGMERKFSRLIDLHRDGSI